MKKNSTLFAMLVAVMLPFSGKTQCASSQPLGSAANFFTFIRNSNNPVAADKNINTVAFVHRNNDAVFGGSNGDLRYDISTNAGTTWTTNLGVLNPAGTNTALGRYPNMAIYNPSLNTTPSNAYVSYMAATFNTLSSSWNGLVSGVRQVSGLGNTETYNQPVMAPGGIVHSLVRGAPGTFWAIDNPVGSLTIYKGTWSSTTNDIVWAFNYSIAPSYLALNGFDYNIAFDPTGTNGWFSFSGHLNGSGPTTAAYYPILYKTTNGGSSWSGPYTVNLNGFGCFSNFLSSGNVASVYGEHDLTVDVNGNPHVFTCLVNSASYALYPNLSHSMFDITLDNGLWAAYPVATASAVSAVWTSTGGNVELKLAPQAARSADGTKVFFTWADNSGYSVGTSNTTPNLFTRAYDVQQKTWTQTKDVTSCNSSIAGKILLPHLAAEVLQPSSGQYKLAPVYADFSVSGNVLAAANFYFLDGVTYASTEFSVAMPSATITTSPANTVIICQGSTVNITVPGAGEAIWNTGATSPTLSVSQPSVYIVTAQKDCYIGSATVTAVNLTVNASTQSAPVCPLNPVSATVTGNATTYTWMPGSVTGSQVTLTAGSTPVFTLFAEVAGCVSTQTVGFNLLPVPTIGILGNDTACANAPVNYTATGAQTYAWSDGTQGNVLAVALTQNTVFTVIGTAANSCTNSQVISIVVIPSPTITGSQSHTAICVGNSATLVALGAPTYSWSQGTQTTNTLMVSPTTTSTFVVTGKSPNGCTTDHSFQVVVNALPTVSISTSKPTFCKGEKMKLTAQGATSYTWSIGVTTPTIQVAPTTNTTYILTGKDANLCVNTTTLNLVVDGCVGLTEQTSNSTLRIYPNPASDVVTVEGLDNEPVFIYDQLGKLQRHYEAYDLKDGRIELSNLAPGAYFVVCGGSCQKLLITN